MPRGMSDDVSSLIVQALARGLSREQISGVVGVSKRAITRVSTNLKKYGQAKPPPSGIKQGRPARMTRRQAEAMLAWVTEHNYTFYVKDLVTFLKDNHGYLGCDGTIRRCLVRAGFRKRLPWHKSEMTVWIPPPNGPRLRVVLEEEGDEKSMDSKPAASDGSGGPENTAVDAEVQDHITHDNAVEMPQPMDESESARVNLNPRSSLSETFPSAPVEAAPESDHSTFPLDPSLQQHQPDPDQNNLVEPALPRPPTLLNSIPHDHGPVHGPGLPIRRELATESKKKGRRARKDEMLQNQVDILQDEVQRQREVILQLQQQLAQSATQVQPSGLSHGLTGLENVPNPPLQTEGSLIDGADSSSALTKARNVEHVHPQYQQPTTEPAPRLESSTPFAQGLESVDGSLL